MATRWTFLFMLSQADAQGRFRCATVGALARAAAITLPQAKRAIRQLAAPDPHSTSKAEEGRRIIAIQGGWKIVNLEAYREYRSKAQRAAAERKARERARKAQAQNKRGCDMSRDVTLGHGQMGDGRRQTSEQVGRGREGGDVAPTRPPSESGDEDERRTAATEALLDGCKRIAAESGWSLDRVLAEASAIPEGNGHPPKAFTDPRARGVSVAWIEASVKALPEVRARVIYRPPL